MNDRILTPDNTPRSLVYVDGVEIKFVTEVNLSTGQVTYVPQPTEVSSTDELITRTIKGKVKVVKMDGEELN